MKIIEYTSDVPLTPGAEPVQFIVTDAAGNQLKMTCEFTKKVTVPVVIPPATQIVLPSQAEAMRQQMQPIADRLAKSNPPLVRSSGTMCYLGLLGKMDKALFDEKRAQTGYEVHGEFVAFIDQFIGLQRLYAYSATSVACHIAAIENGLGGIIGGSLPPFE